VCAVFQSDETERRGGPRTEPANAPFELAPWHPGHSTSPLSEPPAAPETPSDEDLARLRRRHERRRRPGRPPRRGRRRDGAEWRRLRRLVALALVLTVTAVTLSSRLGGGRQPTIDVRVQQPPAAGALLSTPPPEPVRLAAYGSVTLYVPINERQITAIAYHRVAGSPAVDLEPAGRLLNGGLLERAKRKLLGLSTTGPAYYVADGSTASVDVGARAGTQAYSPVTGTVVAIAPYVLNGDARSYGQIVTIQPTADPGVVVVLSHIAVDGLQVGDPVVATPRPTYLGRIVDLSRALRLELGKYTTDAGNGLHVEVQPAQVSDIP
jgi:hypothetical protein